ncbi:excinuclease ABC subunit C, partial [Candidatus Peregrinibacteria bacterium]|nr:excinuclease ABC subunit C [Candidatus Peregrinibacteria bacterium]
MKRQESPTEVLRKRIAEVPTDPGIYRWLSKEGEVLYVGKAKSLRNRVRSYLNGNGKAQGPWKESLIKQIADFDVTVTTSELEALVLETNLIKKLRPKYNVLMKDDKNYVYVRITVYEDFPRIEVVRRIVEDGARYFGPYLSAYDTHRTLEVLHQIYGFKACKASLDFKNGITKVEPRECLEHQIGRCNGLCVNAVTQEQHEAAIDQVMSFFKGHRDPAIARLKEIMREVAAAKKFEKAGELRDSLKLFEHYQVGQLVSDPSGDNTDVVGVALLSGRASVVVMQQRGGKVAGEQQVNLSGQAETICDVLEQFLPQYYEAITDLPDTILVAEDFDERELLSAYLTLQKEKKVTVAVP